jgi:DNA anti-recombination protein RmuC
MEVQFERLKKRYQDLDAKKDRKIQLLEHKVQTLSAENQTLKERIRSGIKRTVKVIKPVGEQGVPGEIVASVP